MRQFLVHAKTFARIERALEAYREDLSPIVMDDEGDLKHPWGKSEAEAMSNQMAFIAGSSLENPVTKSEFET